MDYLERMYQWDDTDWDNFKSGYSSHSAPINPPASVLGSEPFAAEPGPTTSRESYGLVSEHPELIALGVVVLVAVTTYGVKKLFDWQRNRRALSHAQ